MIKGSVSFVVVMAAAVIAEPASAAPILQVAGSTLGCYGSGCSSFGSPVYSGATNALTFTGGSFDVLTDAAGEAWNFALGTFARGNTNVSDSTPPLSFSLQVTFSLPVGVGGSPSNFSAVITGTNHGGGGPESIDFNNAFQTFTYADALGSGLFEFAVINDPRVNKNSSGNPILGAIRGVQYTANPVPSETQSTAIPEPASLLLTAIGLAAAGSRLRRRRT